MSIETACDQDPSGASRGLAGVLREALDAHKPALVDVITANAIPPGTKF
ncbi:MAG: hypothetical protein RDV00_03620 [Clostridia bacterium]|nr:hypothetical protein [Clostridia bacterium]MDQ7791200.1 hypothetical protein [Clostridia bacterium]